MLGDTTAEREAVISLEMSQWLSCPVVPAGPYECFLRSIHPALLLVPGKLPEVLRRQLSLAPGLRPAAQLLISTSQGRQSLLAHHLVST